MKHLGLILVLCTIGLASGCSTERGGTAEQWDTNANAEAYPQPPGSPTERPGMNPKDPRDAQFKTPSPLPQSPSTPQP